MITFRTPIFREFITLRRFSSQISPPFTAIKTLDNVQGVENYYPTIGGCIAQNRYKILHKLAHGRSSTVWLAREQGGVQPEKLVAIKALHVNDSSTNNPELTTQKILQTIQPPVSGILTLYNHFFVEGPNGSRLFLVYPFAGPSMASMYHTLWRIDWNKRLRAKLVRELSKQLVTAVDGLHRAGIVHGDITRENILFNLRPHVVDWTHSDKLVYVMLGHPKSDEFIDHATLANFVEDSVILTDFGASFVKSQPTQYRPATKLNYRAPEKRFQGRVGYKTDVWMLGCAIFEMYTGEPLFCPDAYWRNPKAEMVKQMVETLGSLPDPWWKKLKQRKRWFTEDGKPEDVWDEDWTFNSYSIGERLADLSVNDTDEVTPSKEEVELLADLLEKMLRYRPRDRIRLRDALEHPWFSNY